MSGFSFPPPPPPPPKASQPEVQHNLSARGGSDRGRGRGARGSFDQRGRGQSRGRGRGRGGPDHQHRPFHSHAQAELLPSNGQGSPNNHAARGQHHNASSTGNRTRPNSQHGQSHPKDAFMDLRNTAGHKRKLDALRGPASEKREKKPAPATAPSVPSFGAPFLSAVSPPANKLPPKPAQSPHQSQTQPKPKPARSLGLTPGTNDLQYSSSESEDDENENDEEAMYAELGDKLTFEHNGVVMSLNSQADLVAWKKDRQKNWPTRERMAERFDERRRVGEERKRLLRGAEALYGTVPRPPRVPKSANVDADARPAKASNGEGVKQPETDAEKVKREMLEKNARLEELRRKVTESSARNRRLQEEGDSESPRPSSVSDRIVDTEQQKPAEAGEEPSAADPAATLNGEEQHEDVLDQVENDDPSSTSSDSTSSSSSDSSEDEAPEEMTSKAPPPPLNSGAKLKYDCKYFSASGYCRDGDACRFRHVRQPHHQLQQQKVNGMNDQQRSKGPVRKDDRPPKLDGPGEKKTIFQRWMEQEDDEADRLALQVVKFLGEKGVL